MIQRILAALFVMGFPLLSLPSLGMEEIYQNDPPGDSSHEIKAWEVPPAMDQIGYFNQTRLTHAYSDPFEVSLSVVLQDRKNIRTKVGNFINLIHINKGERVFNFGIDALFIAHFHGKRDWSTPLDTVDGRIGFFGDYKLDRWSVKLSLEHISAHLADGVYGGFSEEKAKDKQFMDHLTSLLAGYSREFAKLMVSYAFSFARFYAGISQVLRIATPDHLKGQRFTNFQGGQEISMRVQPLPFSIFYASDFQFVDEFDYGLNQSHHVGLSFMRHSLFKDTFKVYLHYFNGHDIRGVYWGKRDRFLGLGLSMPLFSL